jgi:uncharacterized protein YjiS (DUF1127 family)
MYLDNTAAVPASQGEGLIANITARVREWIENRRQIARITMELDMHSDHALADMGLSRGDIYAVARGMTRRD